MPDIGTPWAFLFQNSLVGLVVFAAVSAGVIVLLSGGKLGETLGGIFRIFLTIFTTPFTFLRDTVALVRTSSESEQDYAKSTVFMLFRANRIWYMALLVLCLLMLSNGITSAVVSLWPRDEFAQLKVLDEQIDRLEAELATATQAVAAAGTPESAQRLEAQLTEARNAYQQQQSSNSTFIANAPFTGPAIDALSSARSTGTVQNVRTNIEYYMQGCPRQWRNMTAEQCTQYRAFVLELADRKDREFALAQTAQAADVAARDADNSSQAAAAQLANVQQQLAYAQEARKTVNPLDPERLAQKLIAAILGVLGTLWSVIVVVWAGAILIDVFNWLILMMRSLERTQKAKLASFRGIEEEAEAS